MIGVFRGVFREIFRTNTTLAFRCVSAKADVNGVKIAYEKVGSGDRVVLLMPGALGCAETDFSPQIKGLNREKFTVVAWDPRGYGRSIPPKRDFPLDFFNRDAADAAQLMVNLGFAKYSILGWSDGANTATIVAANNPSKIDKLILWGGNAYVTREELEMYEKVRDISRWSEGMRKPMIDMYGEEYFRKTWSDWVDGFWAIFHEKKADICMEEVKRITAPTLLIHGMKDPIVPMFHPENFHESIKGSILDLWPKGKHNLHLREPDKFNAQVEEFLLRD